MDQVSCSRRVMGDDSWSDEDFFACYAMDTLLTTLMPICPQGNVYPPEERQFSKTWHTMKPQHEQSMSSNMQNKFIFSTVLPVILQLKRPNIYEAIRRIRQKRWRKMKRGRERKDRSGEVRLVSSNEWNAVNIGKVDTDLDA